jgi:hypothetical protein
VSKTDKSEGETTKGNKSRSGFYGIPRLLGLIKRGESIRCLK